MTRLDAPLPPVPSHPSGAEPDPAAMHLPRPLARAVAALLSSDPRTTGPEDRGHLLWLLDTPAYRRALPDVPGRVALARAVRDREDSYVAAIGRWLRRGQELPLLTLAVRAGAGVEEIEGHLERRHRLRARDLRDRARSAGRRPPG